jgi:hypothetical protein
MKWGAVAVAAALVAVFGPDDTLFRLAAVAVAALAAAFVLFGGELPRWVVGGLVVLAALIVGAIALDRSAVDDGGTCPTGGGSLASSKPLLWAPTDKRSNKKIVIALDHHVNRKGEGRAFVPLVATPRNRRNKPIPKDARVGAFVLAETLSDGSRDIGFPVTAQARRSRDGRGLDVTVCAVRPKKRSASRPGRYKGTVRVAGQGLATAEIPVEITIKAAQTELVFLALFGALLGAALGAGNSKEAGVTAEAVKKAGARPAANVGRQGLNGVLRILPLVSGLAAGAIAALVVYSDDPTFGAHRGADVAKLLAVTFTAATGGLTVTGPPARAARQRLTA